jgi:PAS domain-containing protein
MDIDEGCFKKDAISILESAPDLYLILTKDFKVIGMSQAYLNATKTERQNILGLTIFDVFPNNPKELGTTELDNLRKSLNRVLINKKPYTMTVLQQDIHQPMSNGQYKNCYWSVLNSPVLDKNTKVKYIIHRIVDITPFVQEGTLSKKMAEEIHQYVYS